MAKYYDNANQAQRFQPGTTVRADEVDAKFDQVASAFSDVESEVDRSLKLVNDGSDHEIAATATQRRNKVVGFDASGTMALLDGFTFRGDFAASTDYFVNDVIRDTTTKNLFVVDERHVSGSTRDDSKMSLAIDVDDIETAKAAAQNAQSAAESAQSSAQDAQSYAEQWANRPEDSLITGAAGGDGVDDFSALHHANKAAGSASAAATSETNASASESAAAASESAAASSEGNASTSETNAANSASAAATSETNAASSESAASTSETNAASSTTSSANSASAAATSESNAATSASNAASSESAAAGSASSAANSASAAATSESNAATSAQSAADKLDSFDDRYLGSKSSEPSTDNDGDPLQIGALYYNTTEGQIYVWDGAVWQQAAFSSAGTVLSFNGRDGIVNLQSADVTNALGYTPQDQASAYGSADFGADFGNESTDNLTEGTSNLYYTDTRARGAVSASGDLSYNAATGEFSFTETPSYTDSDVDAHLTGGTGVTYTTGTIAIGQNVGTNASVTFLDAEFTGTGAVELPEGTEAQRPGTPASGMIRFNSEATSFEGYDGSEWSQLGGSAGGGGAELIATGSIPSAGTPVVLREDGTVEVVGPVSIPAGLGAKTVFDSSNDSEFFSAVYDSAAGKVVIAYLYRGFYGRAVVGTVSGDSISFGDPVEFSDLRTEYISAAYDSAAGKVVIAYLYDSNHGRAIVGTVSGNSISFGSSVEFEGQYVLYTSVAYDSAAGKVVIAYDQNEGYATVGTVSGNSIAFPEPPRTFFGAEVKYISAAYDSAAGKVVIAFQYDGRGRAIAGSVTGNEIRFSGDDESFDSQDPEYISAVYDSAAGKVVIAYGWNRHEGRAVVGTVSGDSISFGSPTVFQNGEILILSAAYDSAAGKVVFLYADENNSFYGTLKVGTVAGNTISFGSPIVFQSSYGYGARVYGAVYDPTTRKFVIAYRDENNNKLGTAIPFNVAFTDSNANNFVGFAQDAASDGDTVLVATNQQIDANQTGLSPKSGYYLDTDGTLTTSDTGYPVAGFALDANTIRTGG